MPHQLFAAGLQAREIYQELNKYFYRENCDVECKDFLTTKFGLWIDTGSSIDNTLYGSVGQWKKVVQCFRSKKHLKPVGISHATCLALKILTIEK